jgi:small subunit ribosomal protein S9
MAYTIATGRRKTSIARIYMEPGTGNITVNKKVYTEYFPQKLKQFVVEQPLNTLEVLGQFDVKINVKGGGITGQSEAIRMAIARALVKYNTEHKPALKSMGFLTRDPRMVERKKFGHKKARKSFQFSKR